MSKRQINSANGKNNDIPGPETRNQHQHHNLIGIDPSRANLSRRPNLEGTVYLDTSESVLSGSMDSYSRSVHSQGQGNGNGMGMGNGMGIGIGMGMGQQRQSEAGQQHSHGQGQGQKSNAEIAGVLKRNQACLQCRKRKLKCDAIRPHCSTCVRSHKHVLRTTPRGDHVLQCDYEDGTGSTDHERARTLSESVDDAEEDHSFSSNNNDSGKTKKKRRNNGTAEGRKRKEPAAGDDSDRDQLMQRIAELESQVRTRDSGPANDSRPWSYQGPDVAPSPTAFLEMLSSAATAQVPAQNQNLPGMKSGASESAMMSSVVVPTPSPWTDQTANVTRDSNGQQGFPSMLPPQNTMPRQSTSSSNSPFDPASRKSSALSSAANSGPSPAAAALSPNVVFNFSPGPTGPPMPTGPTGMFQSSFVHTQDWPPVDLTASGQSTGKVDSPQSRHDAAFQATMNSSIDGRAFPGESVMISEPIQVHHAPAPVDMPALDEALQQQILMDLFWPGWPPNLPEPHIVNDLVEAFFDLVPSLPRLLHRPRFLARMALPPTHSNFPHPALIHAICSCAASWCAPSVYERSAYVQNAYWTQGAAKGEVRASYNFGLKQAAFGKEAVQDGLNTGNRMFDVVRGMIVLSRVFIDHTRMLECWAYCGLVARMILPLGLNVRSAELSLKSVMLPPPVDDLEREERRIAVWMGLYHDTIGSMASGWGTSMSLDELSINLPVSAEEFSSGREDMDANPQDLESSDFWTNHPVEDAFVLCIKANILMNRTNKFVRKWKNRHIREDDDLEGMQKPEFREIANAAACLQMSFPSGMRNVCKLTAKGDLDIDLISAHILPHAAIICLYEPFTDVTDPSDPGTRRVLAATQAIVRIVQQLAASDSGAQWQRNFASVMHASASIGMVTSARTSLLFYRHALNINDIAGAETHRMDIEMMRLALYQFGLRFKIGQHHAQLIEYFLDRATNPTIEKMQAHYPEHPRPGAPQLDNNAHLGICILNALNIKRGYWRLAPPSSTSATPFGGTPDSLPHGASIHRASTTGSASNGSPAGLPPNAGGTVTCTEPTRENGGIQNGNPGVLLGGAMQFPGSTYAYHPHSLFPMQQGHVKSVPRTSGNRQSTTSSSGTSTAPLPTPPSATVSNAELDTESPMSVGSGAGNGNGNGKPTLNLSGGGLLPESEKHFEDFQSGRWSAAVLPPKM